VESFKSRKDAWLRVIIWLSNLLLLVSGIAPLLKDQVPTPGNILLLIIMWGTACFLSWMWLTMAYVLSEEHLLVRFGPFRKSIPYSSIRKVKRTTSILSSAALSTRRLEIHYNRFDLIHISPAEEERFLTRLRERCPQASFEA